MSQPKELPFIPFDDFCKILDESDLLILFDKIGESKAYVFKKKNRHSSMPIILRDTGHDYPFDYAVAMASKAKVLPVLLRWFEVERNFKDGGYFK